jgi:hypothetical protein
MPRPLYDKQRLRDKRLDVYLSSDEQAAIQAKAADAGLRLAAFVRAAALDIKVQAVSEVNAARYAELSRTCSNLNQLAKAANAGRVVNIPPDLLLELLDHVQSLRMALLGVEP